MTLAEAVLVFDRIEHPPGQEAIGIPYCCGQPVIQNIQDSQDELNRIYCPRCGRTVRQIGRQWMIVEWGANGIKLPPPVLGMIVGVGWHYYVSTYCLHEKHSDCRLKCKICEAPCRCECHHEGVHA